MENDLLNFELEQPPITEAWIGGRFEPSLDGSRWDWRSVAKFLDCFDDLDIQETLPRYTPSARVRSRGEKIPKEIRLKVEPMFLRARTESRSRIVQVGENQLLEIQVRGSDSGYPGFTVLLNRFLESQRAFRNEFNVQSLIALELHYVDLVEVPISKFETDLRELFEGAPELPIKPFGQWNTVSWTMGLETPDVADPASVSVELVSVDATSMQFVLHWHRECRGFEDSEESIASRLRLSHNYLKSCFRTLCKQPVWDLFKPTK